MKEVNSQKLESAVMGKIKSGNVRLRSKYIFWAEKLGLGTAFALSVVLSVLFFNLILFYIKETDNLKYLSFGGEGLFAFLETFPYLIVIVFTIFIVLAGYLISKSDSLYKRSFGHLAAFLVIFIMFFGGILTYTNIAENLERETLMDGRPGRFFRPLMAPPEIRDKGIAGIVYDTNDKYLILRTPIGLINVNIEKVENLELANLAKGKFVIGIGERSGHNFIAQRIKLVEKNEMPVIKRGIENKFKPIDSEEECPKYMPPEVMYFEEGKKICIDDCLKRGECIKKCFGDCREVN